MQTIKPIITHHSQNARVLFILARWAEPLRMRTSKSVFLPTRRLLSDYSALRPVVVLHRIACSLLYQNFRVLIEPIYFGQNGHR